MATETPLFTDEFDRMLDRESIDYAELRRHIIRVFNENTGGSIPEDLEADDESLLPVVSWISEQLMTGAQNATFYSKAPRLFARYFETLSSKIISIGQFHCPICRGGFPILNIPIRIRPQSHQAASAQIKNAFKAAIAHRLENTDFDPIRNDDLCIMVTYVISEQRKRKDVDNISKLLLDALQGIVFENDRQIDHLNILQMRWKGDEEWIKLNIRRSDFNSRDDIFYRGMHHGWAGAEYLDLENFFESDT